MWVWLTTVMKHCDQTVSCEGGVKRNVDNLETILILFVIFIVPLLQEVDELSNDELCVALQ